MNEVKFNSQICTTIEQSQRLLELGLKPETADCTLVIINNEPMAFIGQTRIDCSKITINGNEMEKKEIIHVPAWSLARLMELLPVVIFATPNLYITITGKDVFYCTEDFDVNYEKSFSAHSDIYDNAIDCLEWLIKDGYLITDYLNETQTDTQED